MGPRLSTLLLLACGLFASSCSAFKLHHHHTFAHRPERHDSGHGGDSYDHEPHPWENHTWINGRRPSWLTSHGTLDMSQALSGHPRLRVLEKDLERIRELMKSDATAMTYYNRILSQGEAILKQPPVVRPPPGPSGILTTVRVALDRVYVTGLLYRLSSPPNSTWLERGWKELEAAANFSDWNPGHFLDVAEMTHTIAIGYDWFYNELTDAQRLLLETNLEEKGFKPALKAYAEKAFWTQYPDNWNNVCNGGLLVGYLSVYDKPTVCPSAEEVMTKALKALPTALASYGPLGAWPEGVGYWAYATRYTVFAITSLETALGNDKGISETPGFNSTALFVVQATAPSLQFFNYADAGRYTRTEGPTDTPSLFYLATRFNIPAAAFLQRQKLEVSQIAEAEDLIVYTPMGTAEDVKALPLCQYYPRQNIAMARSAWLDPKATWLGVKAGITHEGDPHGHLDVGSFVFETNGYRWAIDLGADSYALPEYFGPKRFTYYRLRNIGHNTLTFDEDNQAENANAHLAALVNCPNPSSPATYAGMDSDLTSAYTPSHVARVLRHFEVDYSSRQLEIYDRISYGESKAKLLTWTMHTYANISITNEESEAILSFGAASMRVSLVNQPTGSTVCPGAKFSQQAVDLAPPQESSKGVSKLLIQGAAPGCTKLTVTIKPV